MMLVLKHWKCIDDASISSEGGNQYEKQALSRRQAALKKRLSLIYRVHLQEDAVLGGERKQEKKNKRQRDKKTRRQSQRKQEGDYIGHAAIDP